MDFIGYHEFEKEYGVEFDFYLYKKSLGVLRRNGFRNPTNLSGEELKELLRPYRVNAGQAIELYRQGLGVGHTVHILRGSR